MEEIITLDGRQFKLTTDRPLTAYEKAQAIDDIASQTGCSTCGQSSGQSSLSNGRIESLAPTCNATAKVVGQTVMLTAQPHGGVAPYTIKFYKGATQIGTTVTGIAENVATTPQYYILTAGDAGTQTFSTTTTDSCLGGSQSCTEQCPITVTTQTLTTITVTPTSPSAISIGGNTTLTAACYDQVNDPMPTCAVTWSTGNSAIATVSTTGLVTGVAGGSTTITATIGAVNKSVTIIVNCNSIVCGFSVS